MKNVLKNTYAGEMLIKLIQLSQVVCVVAIIQSI